MGAMEDSAYVVERHSHSRTTPFTDFTAQSHKQAFYIAPQNVSPFRFLKEGFECTAMLAVHNIIVSNCDTVRKQVCAL